MFGSFRNQKAVYWAISNTKDRYGSFNLETPVEIDVRWQEVNELIIDENGNELASRAIIYPDREMVCQSYLYLGELDDLSTEEKADPKKVKAYPVKRIYKHVDINNSDSLFKVWI